MPYPIYRLAETTPPATEPLTRAEVKTFLRVDHDADDSLIDALISVARDACETATGRSLITRGYSLYLDCWPGTTTLPWWDGVEEGADVLFGGNALFLPRPPLLSVARIRVYNADNSYADMPTANYTVDAVTSPGRIVLADGVLPPVSGRVANGIEVQFTAGYGASGDTVPPMLRQGMKQLIAHLYANRGDAPAQAMMASGASTLFQPYRLASLA